MWVREQCMDALFTEDQSKVAATVHIPYMNSNVCWGKGVKIKIKKKGKRSKHGSKLCHSHYRIKVSSRYEDKSWSWQLNLVLHDNQTQYYMTPWKCYWRIYFIDNNRTTPSKDWHVCSNDFSNDLKKKKLKKIKIVRNNE